MSRSSCIVVAFALAMGAMGSAEAAGVNLFWNDCSVSGVTNQDFACADNTPVFDLYVSIDPPAGIAAANGHNAIIAMQSASSDLPAWWDFWNAGACRELSLVANGDFATGPSGGSDCVDPWRGLGGASLVTYEPTFKGDPGRVRLIGAIAVMDQHAAAMVPGNEYYSIKFRIDGDKTVGGGSCSGCLTPMCLVLTDVVITQIAAPDVHVCSPAIANFTTWQGGNVGGAGCPGVDGPPYDCTTPTMARTWGQIKSLYR